MKKILTIIFTFIFIQTSGQDLIKIGTTKFLHTNGSNNTAIGLNAGNAITTGKSNIFIGTNSGLSNTSGQYNVFLGVDAGINNTTGNENTYIGLNAGAISNGERNVKIGAFAGTHTGIGIDNTYIGHSAGYGSGTTEGNPNIGSFNTFIGSGAGPSNTIGGNNTFLGAQTGLANKTGNYNVFLGSNVGLSNTSGSSNVFIGVNCGTDNQASENLFIGQASGRLNTIGTKNIFLGVSAGYDNKDGSYNTFIGYIANAMGANAASLQRSAAIGYNARVSINDAIVLGDYENANIKVGIGVHNPQYRLDVKGVINMRVGFNSPSMKINDKDFLALDKEGAYVLSNFKLKYENQNQWSDVVFEKNYQLKPIEEVIEFVKINKHLPNVPSANDIVENGLDVNQILPKFLEKIEELTLYVHQISEENKKLKQEIGELKKKL